MEEKNTKINPKYIAVIAVIVLVAIVAVFMSKSENTKTVEKNAVYVKNNKLYMNKDGNDFVLADDMGYAEGYSTFFFGNGNEYSSDNSVMYFSSEVALDGTHTISKVDVNFPENVSVIDTGVLIYNISSDGSETAYIKATGEKLELYVSDGENKYLIRDNVGINDYYFQLSSDGDEIYFVEEMTDGSFNLFEAKTNGENKKQIAEDINDFAVMAEDELIYTRLKENGEMELFSYQNGKETFIADEVISVSFFENNKGFVFIENNGSEIPIWDIVKDDMAQTDAVMEPPLFADYGHQKQDEYLAASYAYDAKKARDLLREEIEEQKTVALGYNLYKYDGKKATILSENVMNIAVFGKNGEYIVIDEVDVSEDGYKVLLSEINDLSNLSYLYAGYENAGSTYVVSEDVKAPIETDNVDIESSMYDEKTGKLLFAADVNSQSGAYHPVMVEMNKGEVSKYSYVEDEVNFANFALDGKLVYVSSGGYLIVVEQQGAVTYDSGVNYMCVDNKNGDVYYINNMETENYTGTLSVLKDGKTTKIDTGVTYVSAVENGKVLYVKNYDETNCIGDLYAYDGSKAYVISEGISCVMDMN